MQSVENKSFFFSGVFWAGLRSLILWPVLYVIGLDPCYRPDPAQVFWFPLQLGVIEKNKKGLQQAFQHFHFSALGITVYSSQQKFSQGGVYSIHTIQSRIHINSIKGEKVKIKLEIFIACNSVFYFLKKRAEENCKMEKSLSLLSSLRGCRLINWMPESVEKPHWISFNGISIVVAVPTVISMCPVLDIENGMTKTGFTICWIRWLWLGHATNTKRN